MKVASVPEADSRHVTLHERGVHSDAVASSMLATLGSLIRLVALTSNSSSETRGTLEPARVLHKKGGDPKTPSA